LRISKSSTTWLWKPKILQKKLVLNLCDFLFTLWKTVIGKKFRILFYVRNGTNKHACIRALTSTHMHKHAQTEGFFSSFFGFRKPYLGTFLVFPHVLNKYKMQFIFFVLLKKHLPDYMHLMNTTHALKISRRI
jgi:hypothetical protein